MDLGPLPSSPQAETALLGSLLLQEGIPRTVVTATDFSLKQNGKIWAAMMALYGDGEPIDYVTLGNRLEQQRELESVGGHAYLVSLTEGLPRGLNTDHYAQIVVEKAAMRATVRQTYDAIQAVLAGGDREDVADILFRAAQRIRGEHTGGVVSMTATELDEAAKTYCHQIDSARTPTGIRPLDQEIGGVGPGQVLTILGRTGTGKSAVAQTMVKAFLARKTETSAIFCSAEMPPVEFWIRQRQIEGRVKESAVIHSYREGTGTNFEFMERAHRRLLCVANAGWRLSQVEQMISREVKAKRILPPQHVLLDYLGLFAPERATKEDTNAYGQIAKQAKIMAKSMGVSVVLLAQANRGAGDGSQPVTLTDARQSGEIEEAADFLVGMWRPGIRSGDPRELGMAILKGRRCALAEWRMRFDGPTLSLSEVPVKTWSEYEKTDKTK